MSHATFDRPRVVEMLDSQRTRVLAHCDAPATELTRTYAPNSWTVAQVLAHLADVEFVNYWRFCRAVAEPGSNVEAFDQDAWDRVFDYTLRPIAVTRAMFAGMRGAFVLAARSLPETALKNVCLHPEKGRMSGEDWLALQVAHTEHHLGQIEAARAQTPWNAVLTSESWKYGAKPAG